MAIKWRDNFEPVIRLVYCDVSYRYIENNYRKIPVFPTKQKPIVSIVLQCGAFFESQKFAQSIALIKNNKTAGQIAPPENHKDWYLLYETIERLP